MQREACDMTVNDDAGRPDRRTHAWRDDLAAAELHGTVDVPRYVDGREARVIDAVAPVRRRPDPAAVLETEAIHGERVRVLDEAGGWSWIQLLRDRYVGYIPSDCLSFELLESSHRVQAPATFVYPAEDIKAPPRLQLPLGALIAVEAEGTPFSRLAGGGYLMSRHIVETSRHARDFVDIAERFIGSPYLWGGRTRNGLDCSGLVQISLEAAGIASPRDSDMQEAMLGTTVLVPGDLEGLERGDLVFWPGHVGIMVDGVMLLHANAHHMSVAVEPLSIAADRIRRTGARIGAIKRLASLSAGDPTAEPWQQAG
jgi:cell wall-associated NlpC family hydrolase